NVLALERERDRRLAGRLARAAQLGLAEVHARRVAAASRELDGVPAEAAGRIEHARAGLEPDHAGDPLHVARGVGPGLDRLRDLGPRFAEEPLALEHEGHYIPVHDDPGYGRV